jgi:hypothetical protein
MGNKELKELEELEELKQGVTDKSSSSLPLREGLGVGCLILLGILAIIVLAIVLLSKCMHTNDNTISIEPTPNEIRQIMPQNELYVATALIEDYTTLQQTEYHFGVFPEEHSCVQILRQKVSYKLDLSKVEYTPRENHIMEVRMPELAYTASTQASQFISDNESYWSEALPSTNELRHKVEQQIRTQFDTPENRQKAILFAQEAITHILTQLGYQPEFINTITPHSEGNN